MVNTTAFYLIERNMLTLFDFSVLVFSAFIAAIFNAVFATGGIYLLIAVLGLMLPLDQAIPLLPLVASGSLLGRLYFIRALVDWRFSGRFAVGALAGAILGGVIFTLLPVQVIGIGLSAILLFMVWVPIRPGKQVSSVNKRHAVAIGLLHTAVSTIVGAGGVLQAYLIRHRMPKLELTATLAACTSIMEVWKVSAYMFYGFPYKHHFLLLCACFVVGIVGTLVGLQLTAKVPDRLFRLVFKWLVTGIAIQVLVKVFL